MYNPWPLMNHKTPHLTPVTAEMRGQASMQNVPTYVLAAAMDAPSDEHLSFLPIVLGWLGTWWSCSGHVGIHTRGHDR